MYGPVYIFFKGRLIRIMWHVSAERWGTQLGDLLRGSGGPCGPPWGLNTLRQCPSLTGCPSEGRGPRVDRREGGAAPKHLNLRWEEFQGELDSNQNSETPDDTLQIYFLHSCLLSLGRGSECGS